MEGKWREKFPAMPTERQVVTSVCTGTALIVAGGVGENYKELTTVEVLDIENRQWSTAVDLPESLQCYSATVCGDQLYMLGGAHRVIPTKSVYTCSLSALLQTCTQRSSLEEPCHYPTAAVVVQVYGVNMLIFQLQSPPV